MRTRDSCQRSALRKSDSACWLKRMSSGAEWKGKRTPTTKIGILDEVERVVVGSAEVTEVLLELSCEGRVAEGGEFGDWDSVREFASREMKWTNNNWMQPRRENNEIDKR